MLRLPLLPELMVRSGNFQALVKAFESSIRPEAFGAEVLNTYRAAWAQPGAVTAMLNWYRALFCQALPVPAAGSLTTPTLVIWGDQDDFAEPGLAEASAALCAEARVLHLPEATHWVVHDKPAEVWDALRRFLEGGAIADGSTQPFGS